jgi:hypothetical protein
MEGTTMNLPLPRIGALATALIVAATLAAPASAAPSPLGSRLAEVRAATVAYHDVAAAIADGFEPTDHCVGDTDGAMGFHYVNLARVLDGRIDPAEPEVLLYAPRPDGTPAWSASSTSAWPRPRCSASRSIPAPSGPSRCTPGSGRRTRPARSPAPTPT